MLPFGNRASKIPLRPNEVQLV